MQSSNLGKRHTDQHDDQVGRSVFFYFVNPVRNRLEGGPPGEVVGDDGRVGAAVVALGDGPEALLACGVPHLHLEKGRKGGGIGSTHA